MSNEGKAVRVHYVGTLDDGTKFDSSRDRGEPLEFICMAGMMIPGFDVAVRDMEVGETVTIRLEPKDAYGERNDDMVKTFDIAQLPGSENLVQGMRVMLSGPYGQPIPALVSQKDDKTVTLDLNHEMAGKALTFEIELLEAAEAEEHHCCGGRGHGHGHGCCHDEGGHHHDNGECCHGEGHDSECCHGEGEDCCCDGEDCCCEK